MDARVTGNRLVVEQAALRVLRSDGVGGLTVDRLAEVSGVSRSTIYRHWPDLRSVVLSAFSGLLRAGEAEVDLADPERALSDYLHDYAGRLNDPQYASVLIAILEWSWRDPELARAYAAAFDDSRSRARAILQAGRTLGVFDTTLSLDEAIEAVVAPFLYRRLVLRRTISEAEIRALQARLRAR
jgi:AcrR family transcriptional regulator